MNANELCRDCLVYDTVEVSSGVVLAGEAWTLRIDRFVVTIVSYTFKVQLSRIDQGTSKSLKIKTRNSEEKKKNKLMLIGYHC